MTFRRIIRLSSLLLFIGAIIAAAMGADPAGLDLYLQLDPSLALMSALSGRALGMFMVPALAVMAFTLLFGRVFCGYICPMGTTIDVADHLLYKKRKASITTARRRWKYLTAAFLLGAALFGTSWVYWLSPLSLTTRLYGLAIYPVLSLLADYGLNLARPLTELMDWTVLSYLQIKPPRFAAPFYIVFIFTGVFLLGRFAPRFWCRYLCPSGGLLALASVRPLIRRRVSDACTHCGKCEIACPMAAIPKDNPETTLSMDCSACRTCVNICPEQAVSFGVSNPNEKATDRSIPGRRQFLSAGALGLGSALVGGVGLTSPLDKTGEGSAAPPGLLRPPGAIKEPDFLALCVRCGQCMVACPTNTLQPILFERGLLGLFSPSLNPRRGFCDPHCRRCGQICPTGAIRTIAQNDRIFAKTGTAVIRREACLAWEHQKPCLVCDEVCPFDAVHFKPTKESSAAAPHVIEEKCAGCGFCEYYCPVMNQAAIEVKPMGEIRINDGTYREAAENAGFRLSLEASGEPPLGPSLEGAAPGFDSDGTAAPGFDSDETGAPGFDSDETGAPGFDSD